MLKTAENQELGAECEHDLYSQTRPLLSFPPCLTETAPLGCSEDWCIEMKLCRLHETLQTGSNSSTGVSRASLLFLA